MVGMLLVVVSCWWVSLQASSITKMFYSKKFRNSVAILLWITCTKLILYRSQQRKWELRIFTNVIKFRHNNQAQLKTWLDVEWMVLKRGQYSHMIKGAPAHSVISKKQIMTMENNSKIVLAQCIAQTQFLFSI